MNTNKPLKEQPPRPEPARPRFCGRTVLHAREVARELGVTKQHVIALIDEGLLPAINVGKGSRKIWRIPVEKFEAFLAQRSA